MTTGTESPQPTAGSATLIPTYVGRQPIFDVNLDVRAYEILFRDGVHTVARFSDSDLATAQTFWNTFIELGLRNVSDGSCAYLNVSRAFLMADCAQLFPADRIAIEVSGRETLDGELQTVLRRLSEAGFRIVLQDYNAAMEPLLELARSVKLDVQDGDFARVKQLVPDLNERDLTTIATKIETFAEFEDCRKIGFEGFQGNFLAKPQVVAGGRLPADGLTRLRLLKVINDPGSSLDEIVDVISQDISLSYKILHYVNSAMLALANEIESIHQAVMMLGLQWVRTWTNLVILSGFSDKPQAVFHAAVIRAKMCELIGSECEPDRADVYFTIGLFSALDCLMDRPMSEILSELPLKPEMNEALVGHQGPLGQVLACALAYERASWDDVTCTGLDPGCIRNCYIAALDWADELRGALAA